MGRVIILHFLTTKHVLVSGNSPMRQVLLLCHCTDEETEAQSVPGLTAGNQLRQK